MVSLKRTAKEVKERNLPTPDMSEGDKYPWGLQIRLDKDTLKKLGMDASKWPSQKTGEFKAKFFVSESTFHPSLKGDPDQRLELQITDMEIGEEDEKKKQVKELM